MGKPTTWSGTFLRPWTLLAGPTTADGDSNEKETSSPKIDATDDVLPFHFIDDQPHYRLGVVLLTFRFNAVLDVEKLHSALLRVYELDGWHKLGARIRLNKIGKLEHHVPKHYTDERPAFNWAHTKQAGKIEDHPQARKIPNGGVEKTIPSIYADVESFKDVLYPTDILPTKMDDYLSKDIAPISFHVASFDNATLLTMTFTHTAMDALCAAHLLQAWTAILDGKEDAVRPFLENYNTDFIKEIINSNRSPASKHVLHPQRLSGLSMLGCLWTTLSDIWWYPKDEWRTICLPGAFVSKLKADAVKACGGHFLSEGDVLSAFRNRLIATALQLKPQQPIGMLQYFNLFGVMKELPADRAYIGNASVRTFTSITAGELLKDDLGTVAYRIRQELKRQRTQEQAEAYLTLHKDQPMMMFGAWNQIIMGWSNFSKAGFFDMDFSPAVIGEGSGKPVYVHNSDFVGSKMKIRNIGPCLGQDAHGNWWMSWIMRSDAWPRVEQQLARHGPAGRVQLFA